MFLKRFYYKLIRKNPAEMEMVQYWKEKESVAAKVTKSENGSIIMRLDGEKYPFPSFPRAHLLFGHLSKLKHEIKNQIFNDNWWRLEKGDDKKEVIADIKRKLFGEIAEIAKPLKYEMLPPETMSPTVREIYRAWTKVAPHTYQLRDYLCLILQEDDAYRFRVQWLVKYFNPKWFNRNFVKLFEKGLQMMEHAEVVGDMKERIRLLRRILLLVLEDENVRNLFEKLCREIDWKKVKLTKADAYHFRGKYFKVDMDVLEY